MAKLVLKITSSSAKINHKYPLKEKDPLKEGDITRRKPDISKMKKVLNRKLLCLEEGIEKVYKFLK